MVLDVPTIVRLFRLIDRLYPDEFANFPGRLDLSGLDFSSPVIVWGSGLDDDYFRPFGAIVSDDLSGELVLALRGTETNAEWIQNLRFFHSRCPFIPGADVERGFLDIYESLRTDRMLIRDALAGAGSRLTVTGHSLGGALATLAAADIGAKNLATAGCPRVGDANFARGAAGRITNIVRCDNKPDLVPDVPPSFFDYCHVGNGPPLDSTGIVKDELWCDHNIKTYIHLLDAEQPLAPQCTQ